MKRWSTLAALALFVSACSAPPTPLSTPVVVAAVPPTVASTPTALPPTVAPTLTPLAPTPEPAATLGIVFPTVAPTVSVLIDTFADIPGNVAKGELAPDFTARVMGGKTFTLSEQHGSPVLLFPTVPGCGDCVFIMEEMDTAYRDYRGRGIAVVVLSLYPEDDPEWWQPFADYIAEPEFMWGVVNSTDFAVQYNITSLGTTMLVDPEGKLVFRSEYPVLADGFRQLFDLATR